MFDILIRGGQIIDGTRSPRYPADIGIVGDRITAIGDLREAHASQILDATHRIVAPGFIDVHNHSDGWLFREPVFVPKLRQGFTTELLMSDGISYAPVDAVTRPQWAFYLKALNALTTIEAREWQSLAEFRRALAGRTAQNFLLQVPYANVRSLHAGFGRGALDDLQRKIIAAGIRQGMEEGATGLSTGLDYISQCFATTDDLVHAATAMREHQGVYVTHIRYKVGIVEGVREAVEIGRRAGVPVHISHLKPHNERDSQALMHYIDTVATQEVDFTWEVYPYQPGSTMLNYLLPYEVWEDGPLAAVARLLDPAIRLRFRRALESYRLALDQIHIAWVASADNKPYQGQRLSEYVAATGLPAEDALLQLLIEERLAVLLVFHDGDDALMKPYLAHPRCMCGSDAIYFPDGVVHPRVTGTAPRMLGTAVRDWKLFSLEDAVYKLAGFAAQRFGVLDRGTLAQGKFADVVVFDPLTVADRGTFAAPHQDPIGIEHVIVNGRVVLEQGRFALTNASPMPGRGLLCRQ